MAFSVEYSPHMETIQVVLDKDLLRAADKAAKRVKVNRSALIRDALREHLKRLRTDELEMRDRQGFEQHPDSASELTIWERVAAWPED
ncbi:MAG: ribbon-helix-helix protein, CopG family [Bryobacteraceae bacterium]